MKILLAEDDSALQHALKTLLQRNCYTVDAVQSGTDALDYLRLGNYDGAVLDVMMPGLSGVEVVLKLREEQINTPVLLLTAKSQIEDRVTGLDAGANDYLTKPFDIRELLARLRVLTRQVGQSAGKQLQFGNLQLDTADFTMSTPKGSQILINKEYQVLLQLMRQPGTIVSAEAFLEQVWEPDSMGQENALWTVIYNLRRKLTALEADVQINTRRNLGYVLERSK